MVKSNRGISIIESMVCMVVIGIGFIAIMQLSAFSINSMDRATEKNKLNYLSEMVMEDMIGDPDNVTSYGGFIKTCSHSLNNGSNLYQKMQDKWRNRLEEKNQIRINNKDKRCHVIIWIPKRYLLILEPIHQEKLIFLLEKVNKKNI